MPASASASKPKQPGHAAAGRSVFNGKGVCYYCHGVRAKIIREGHEGTAMFPDTTMTDQDIADTLAYLALLRREGVQAHGERQVPTNKGKKP